MRSHDILHDNLITSCATEGVSFQLIEIENIVFEERVHLKCLYCERYDKNWRCPPKIPALDYKKIVGEFNNHALVYNYYKIDSYNKDTIRTDSTNHLHKALLNLEKTLFNNNNSFALSFIGGSCKLCKNGCGDNRCNNPVISRIPLEAIGINIEKTADNYDIKIKWPVTDSMIRIGMLLW
jgi:predicted metal-binding protein